MDVVLNWLRRKEEEDVLVLKADLETETAQKVEIETSHDQNLQIAVLDPLVNVKHLIHAPGPETVPDQKIGEEKFQGLDLDLLTVAQDLRKRGKGLFPGAKVEAQEDQDLDLEIVWKTGTAIGKRMIEGMIEKVKETIKTPTQ